MDREDLFSGRAPPPSLPLSMRFRSLLVPLVVFAGLAAAPQSRAQLLGETPTAFSYQGVLTQAGAPANGTYDFRFQLFPLAFAGSQVGASVDVSGVTVTNGVFTVEIEFSNSSGGTWDGGRWMKTLVRPVGGGVYTELAPRTRMLAAPYANNLRVPMDVTKPYGGALLNVTNTNSAGSTSAVRGESTSPAGYGVFGVASSTDANATAAGVRGQTSAPDGAGVQGRTTGAGGFATVSYGVFGEATATSGFTRGVFGTAASTQGFGVSGAATAATGFTRGVYGQAVSSPDGVGVYGTAQAAGVEGVSGATTGRGVYGRATSATGNPAGVYGVSASTAGYGVFGEATAASGTATGVYGISAAASGYGVFGWATSASGSADGVVGRTSAAGGYGVSARNTAGGYAGYFGEKVRVNDGLYVHNGSAASANLILDADEGGGAPAIKLLRAGVTVLELDADHNGDARVITQELEITGGSDLSEMFDVAPAADGAPLAPGMVVAIDPAHPGRLAVSTRPYDPLVAGVVSGAGGVETGLLMGQRGSVADGDHPVALVGRVYVLADAAYGPVRPGDLLTTSGTPGHAMRAADPARTGGAVLGKAMTALASGRGLVLVLVSLQ